MVKHLVQNSSLSKIIVRGLATVGFVLGSIACAPRVELSPYSNLIDQGLLPVSTTNPYLGANLFLAGEAQRSGYLLNFLKEKGGPVAIELENDNFGATGLIMYYPKDREVYRAELQPVQRGNVAMAEWLVRGPYAIERRDYRELNRLDGSLVGEPVFMIRGQLTKFGQQSSQRSYTALSRGRDMEIMDAPQAPIVPIVPTPKPKKRPVISKPSSKESHEATASATPTPQPSDRPLNSDQKALRLAQGLVDRNDAGDALHIVVSDKQTLAKLAEWYTGDAKNADAIASASGIEPGKEPSLASRVVIPRALVKNEKRLID